MLLLSNSKIEGKILVSFEREQPEREEQVQKEISVCLNWSLGVRVRVWEIFDFLVVLEVDLEVGIWPR